MLAANDAMAFGAIEAFKEAKKKLPLIVGINASKEAVDFIKAGDMLASGDYNGLIEGCLGAEIAIRTLHKQPVPKEILAKTSVVDKSNLRSLRDPGRAAALPDAGEHRRAVRSCTDRVAHVRQSPALRARTACFSSAPTVI